MLPNNPWAGVLTHAGSIMLPTSTDTVLAPPCYQITVRRGSVSEDDEACFIDALLIALDHLEASVDHTCPSHCPRPPRG